MATYYKPPKAAASSGARNNPGSGPAAGSPVRYAAYLRCSNDDQTEGDYTTIDTQRELTEAYVKSRSGVLVGVWMDDGVSGTRKRRPGLDKLMQAAKARQIDAVVVTYMSRLGRGDAYTIIEDRLRECRVRVELVQERFADDLTGYTQQALTKFLDGMYPVQVRQWTVTKMEQMHRAGLWLGGAVPFGCKAVAAPSGGVGKRGTALKVLVADTDGAAPMLRAAFDVFLRSRCVMDVADYLSRATGRTWCHHRTRYMLANRTYIGESTWRGIMRPNPATAIVDPDVFAAAGAILAEVGDRTRRRSRRPDIEAASPHAYYLRGVVFCGCCALPEADAGRSSVGYYRMSTKDAVGRSGAIRYYECLNLQKRRADSGCTIKRINAAALHDALIAEFAAMAAHPWRVRKHIEAALPQMAQAGRGDARAHLESVRRRLRENRKATANLESAVKAGGAGVIGFLADAIGKAVAEREVLESEERRLSGEIERARRWRPDVEEIRQTLSLLGQLWPQRTDEEKSQMLGLLVDRVVMRSRQVAEVVILPAMGSELRIPESRLGGYGDTAGVSSAKYQAHSSLSPQFGTSRNHLPIIVRINSARIIDLEEVRGCAD